MSRKRHRLVPETFGLKRRRELGDVEADPLRGESAHVAVTRSLRPGSARAAVAEIVRLFPRVLFEDALPPIALRSQVYSLVPDRTVADRQLKALQEQGEIRIVQLGFDLDAQGIMFTEDYRTRVLKACDGRPYAAAVQKFLASVLPACGDLSFQQDQMTQTFGFRDPEITAPDCPQHGPEGQVPGTTPFRAPGPAGTCLGATRPRLPRARPHWGPAGGLCLHHFWNPPPPARDLKTLLVIAHLPRVGIEGPRRAAHPG
ncbi:inactive serine/threonine-protein kinase 19 isoform 1-T1 [Dama dama]|uniref:inactive serine/threonine-protein kinase 19 isoform X2 n=1 Tax=Dama dama TaxID=30532 RepID=UPI002A3641F0|nr:inactive serine/threonine-protein kinase 19 isoform X2 [Dama dama]